MSATAVKPLVTYWAAAAAYELGHKVFALRDRKARVQKPDWYACYPFDKPKPTEFERSRPLVASERVLATAMAMAWAPVLSPLHLAGDLVEAELWLSATLHLVALWGLCRTSPADRRPANAPMARNVTISGRE